MLTVGSLFSGVGGIDLGLQRAGMRITWQVEIDDYCRRVLARHWPDVRRWEDVRTFPPEPPGDWRVDLIAGGFPCQPVSLAGKGKGEADERWLWPEFARVLRVLRPRYALVENVPGLLVRGFDGVLGDLAELGYDAEWGSLSACAMGAPHTRERVFIVAHTNSVLSLQGMGHHREMLARLSSGDGPALHEVWLEAPTPPLRVADGAPTPMDRHRLRALGNAVVPQVAQWLGERILAAHGRERR